jgi:hypothetical protein
MSGQYQERIEYFKQYREKNKERLQQKRHDYYEENNDRIKNMVILLFILGSNLGGVGPVRGLRGGGRGRWCEEWARSG